MSKRTSTESLEQQLREQLRDLLESEEQLREEQLLLWEQQSQYGTHTHVQEMMRLTLAIVDNFERREEVAKKLEEVEHRVQGIKEAPSNDGAEHNSLQQLNSKNADRVLSEVDRLFKEADILENRLDEAIKQHKAILDWKENTETNRTHFLGDAIIAEKSNSATF